MSRIKPVIESPWAISWGIILLALLVPNTKLRAGDGEAPPGATPHKATCLAGFATLFENVRFWQGLQNMQDKTTALKVAGGATEPAHFASIATDRDVLTHAICESEPAKGIDIVLGPAFATYGAYVTIPQARELQSAAEGFKESYRTAPSSPRSSPSSWWMPSRRGESSKKP